MQRMLSKFASCSVLLGIILLGHSASAADTYKFDAVHSQITFFVSHLGFSNSSGRFRMSDSALQFDEKDWSKASVQVTIPMSSLDMGDATWKEHLSGARFFEVDKYPTMTFKSTKVDVVSPGQLKVTGDLTLHGVTKSVVLDTKVNKVGEHPMLRRPAVGFSATTRIKRSDFGMTQMLPMIGDDIDIRIEAEGSVPAAK
jgi:polyisoprenoid-binding protein YceI